MCLLVIKPEGVKLPKSVFHRATQAHPDGFGIAFADRGKVRIWKGVNIEAEDQIAKVGEYANHAMILHWRWATHGAVEHANAHPFSVHDYAMGHNGVLRGYGSMDKSDTRDFAERIMVQCVNANAIEFNRKVLERLIVGSRIATIHPDGNIVKLGSGWVRAKSGAIHSNTSGMGWPKAKVDKCEWCERGEAVIKSGQWYVCASCFGWAHEL